MKYGYGTSSVKVRQGRKVGRWRNTRIERLHDAPPLMLIISKTHQQRIQCTLSLRILSITNKSEPNRTTGKIDYDTTLTS